MTWQKLLTIEDFPSCGVLETELDGADLLVWRLQDGSFAAIDGYCAHMQNYIPNGLAPGASLSELVRNDEIVCPFHGWRFDHSGRCTLVPVTQATPKKVERGEPITQVWRVRVQDGCLEIEDGKSPEIEVIHPPG